METSSSKVEKVEVVGSSWEEEIRSSLYVAAQDTGADPTPFLELLETIVEDKTWEKFGLSFKEFIEKPLPDGIGMKLSSFVALVFEVGHRYEDNNSEVRGRMEAMRRVVKDLLAPVLSEHRRPTKQEQASKRDNTNFKGRGTSASYILARLKRDRPDLAEKVINGEMTANAAAIAAGFKQRTKPFYPDDLGRTARLLREHFEPDALYAAMVEAGVKPAPATLNKDPEPPPPPPEKPAKPKRAKSTTKQEQRDKGDNTSFVDQLEQAEKKYEQKLERLKSTKAQGVNAEYTAHRLVEIGGDTRGGGNVFIIADADDVEDVRSVLMLDSPSSGRDLAYIAAFAFFELADVYLYRLRKKGIVSENMRIVRLEPPERTGFPDRPESQLEKRVGKPRKICGCDEADAYAAAYNQIQTPHSRGSTKRVEWYVMDGIKSSEDLEREEQEAKEKKIRDFYGQEGYWTRPATPEDANKILDTIEEYRGRIEVEWMDAESKYHGIGHTAGVIDAINSGHTIITMDAPEYGFALGGNKYQAVPREDVLNTLLAACSEHSVLLIENKHPF